MNAIAKKPLRQVQNVQQLLMNDMARDQLAMVAAGHMKPERMMRIMAQSIRKTPKLGQCEPLSLLGAMMACASLGLEPGGPDGHAYLLPFENKRKGITEVQLIIGYKGYLARAWRSGIVKSIQVGIHYSDDEHWLYRKGSDAILEHIEGPQEGEKLHAYCIVKVVNGGLEGEIVTCLPWKQIMKTRDNSNGWKTAVRYNKTKDSPWFTHEDAMAIKTSVRKTAQSGLLPMSSDYVNIDGADDGGSDFQSFAMDPTGGLIPHDDGVTIDGEATETDEQNSEESSEPEQEPEAKQDEAPKAETKKQAAKKEKPAPKEAEQAKPETKEPSDTDMFVKLVDMVKTELENATDQGEIEGVLDMYANEVEQMQGTPFHDQIQEAADERREALA